MDSTHLSYVLANYSGEHTMLKFNVIGIDLAKNVLQICVINKHGELVSNKMVSRQKLKERLAKSSPSIVSIEGYVSSHYWGLLAESFGHDVRIISPKKVKGFLEGHKTDANDALAIANAAMQIGLKYSKPKNEEQQSLQSLENIRIFLSRNITSLSNHIRAMLYEYGIVSAKGAARLRKVIEDTFEENNALPTCLISTLSIVGTISKLEKAKNSIVRQIKPCKQLMALEGVAEVCAGMLYSSIGNGKQFKNGREASAFVGLTPKKYSSGGKVFMMGIDNKGGVKELRTALYQVAMSIVTHLPDEPKKVKQAWLIQLVKRVGIKRICLTLANKTVRTAWAMLRHESKHKQQQLIAA
jgi:transposase